MSLTLIAPPPEEPVSIAELKAHLKIDSAAEDALIAGFGVAARQAVEARFGLAIVAQTWRLTLDCAGEAAIVLPISPVVSIDAVAIARGGSNEALTPDAYEAEAGLVGRVRLKSPSRAAGHGLVILFTAGFGDAAAVPEELKLAIRVLAAHFYEHREGDRGAPAPAALSALLAPYRQVRL
jgi:uncharacterized phiE125 gp8 family phage protein